MTPLPGAFLERPLAHRGLHGLQPGHPENSLPGFRAAVAAGYGVEMDVQLSSDNRAMVFHDYSLERLTAERGPVRQRSAAELGNITLTGAETGIPTLEEVLTQIDGRVPVLIELKDQDGALGPGVGKLEHAVATALEGYRGSAAVMSFNPYSIRAMAHEAPGLPRGLVTDAFTREGWPLVPVARLDQLRPLPDAQSHGISFISHDVNDLDNPAVTRLAGAGLNILCWTVRSPEQETAARKVADNITFEGYLPKVSP